EDVKSDLRVLRQRPGGLCCSKRIDAARDVTKAIIERSVDSRGVSAPPRHIIPSSAGSSDTRMSLVHRAGPSLIESSRDICGKVIHSGHKPKDAPQDCDARLCAGTQRTSRF